MARRVRNLAFLGLVMTVFFTLRADLRADSIWQGGHCDMWINDNGAGSCFYVGGNSVDDASETFWSWTYSCDDYCTQMEQWASSGNNCYQSFNLNDCNHNAECVDLYGDCSEAECCFGSWCTPENECVPQM
jgi:hypothetical protein